MSQQLLSKLLANLPPINAEQGDFGKTLESNLVETQLLRLATVSLDQETQVLRTILDSLGKIPKRGQPSKP